MYNLENGASWTSALKNAFKTGTTYASLIYNQQEYNESNFLKEAELKDVRYVPNAGFIGQAVSRMLTIKMVNNENSNLNFENADVQFKIGTIYNGTRYNINYGNFIVDEAPKNDATNGTVSFVAYDYMIKFNKDYVNRVIYPCTLKNLLLDVCSQAGVELGTSNFANQNFIVEDNQFEGKQLREVLQHIAKCAFSWARIGQDNRLYLDFSVNNNNVETITIDDYKTDSFKKANEYYGPVNKVTFGDSDIKGQEESVQDDASIDINGLKEIIINDNYFAYTTEKRHELIQAGTSLFGLRYMPIQSLDLIGLIYLDCNDIIEVEDLEGTVFTSRVFSHIINYNGITSDNIATTGESDNEREYVNTNNSIAQNARTEIIVDRAKKEITAVIEEVGEQNQKIARVTQTVDELNSKISDIADITTSLESNSARLEFEGINQSEPIRVVIHPVGVNILRLYPNINLKPSSTLKIKTRILRFQNTTTNETFDYELPDDLLYYDSENYDEFIMDYESLTCIVNKKCKLNSDGQTVELLANERTDEYTFPHIEITDGDYIVSLVQYSNGYIFARMMAQNIYTTQFATKAELNSEISQTVDNINLSVNERLTNYSTTTEMNSAIDLKANEITSSVSETYTTKDALNSVETSLNSKIDQTAEGITSTVSQVEEKADAAQNAADDISDDLSENYYTKTATNSAIEQKAKSITTTVSETYSTKADTASAIDNIKIGGTNLLRFTQSGENWVKSSFNEQELTFTRETTSTGESFITHPKAYLALEKNTQYTLSAWIKSNGKVKSLDIWCYDKNTDHPQSKSNISVNTTWQFVTWTFTTNNYSSSDYSQTTIRFDNNGSTTQGQNAILYVKKPKLEIGNKATDWQPSSEDYSTTTQMNSAITQKANEITSSVSETYATKTTTNSLSSRIKQTAKTIELTTKDNSTSAGITIKLKNEDGTQIDSKSANITLSGLVKFTDLSTSGSTTINGSNITTGTINANLIKTGTLSADRLNGGTITASSINLGNGTFEVNTQGAITATSGTIGGFSIINGRLRSNNKKTGMSSSTFSGDPAFWAGNTDPWENSDWGNNMPFYVTNQGYLKATNATISGIITATSGNIAGWNIDSSNLSKVVGNYSIELRTDRPSNEATLLVWDKANGRYNWYVRTDGYMYARNADISGTITATSGNFDNCNIKSNCNVAGNSISSSSSNRITNMYVNSLDAVGVSADAIGLNNEYEAFSVGNWSGKSFQLIVQHEGQYWRRLTFKGGILVNVESSW